jgi:hypothetical protein
MPFSFNVNELCAFSRVKSSKKKKLKKKEIGELMRSAKELTLKDGSNFVLLEYCVSSRSK